ncbi:NahK/ErcS family hybrid sensor histidine kinase/response regulator, partial [Halioxenophilus aromaticivorans]|uniref:hybrid sensor histidine kinase/response regulator n=1 Tax=Halioxenophilus aromaticivorans TaxID=1306992 RepID=UPI0031E898CB
VRRFSSIASNDRVRVSGLLFIRALYQIYTLTGLIDYEFVNKSFEDWFEKPRDQICGQAMSSVLGEDNYLVHKPYIEGALGGRTVNFEVSQSNGDKDSRDFRKTFIPHFSADRAVVGFFALEQDITAQRRTAQALQQAYEYMEKRVNARTHEISAINLQLRQEITERQQVEAHLIEAKKMADEANESKTRFLAAASHDLLQPMNAARLFATALRDQQLGDEAHQLVDSLGYSLENVEALISSLVDISKLEAGVVEAAPESFHIDDLLHKLAAEYRPQAQKIGLHLDYISSKAVIFSDSQLLARVLRNLLSNAIRYTPSGKLVLGCRRRVRGVEIQVWDTGIGIERSKLGEIFREFSRIDAARTRTDKGLGLGLAIVERLSRVLGHEVSVKSWPGKGSCFSLLVPFGQPLAPTIVNPIELDSVGLPLREARVLVVDNDHEICDGMKALLATWHCKVMTAQGLAQLNEEPELLEFQPQLMIADFHLDNDETGLQAIAAVHQRLQRDIPVILITADYTNELRQTAKSAGYVILNKPVKPLKLKMLMSNFLRESKAREAAGAPN